MQIYKDQDNLRTSPAEEQRPPRNIIELDSDNLLRTAETICSQCRYPFLGLRILIHIVCGLDNEGKIHISARHFAKKLDVHYDTVTKVLKFLRHTGVIQTRP